MLPLDSEPHLHVAKQGLKHFHTVDEAKQSQSGSRMAKLVNSISVHTGLGDTVLDMDI